MVNIAMNNNEDNTIKNFVNGKQIFRMNLNLNLTEIIDLMSSMNFKSQQTHQHYTQPHTHTHIHHYGHCYDTGQRGGQHGRGGDMGVTGECFL